MSTHNKYIDLNELLVIYSYQIISAQNDSELSFRSYIYMHSTSQNTFLLIISSCDYFLFLIFHHDHIAFCLPIMPKIKPKNLYFSSVSQFLKKSRRIIHYVNTLFHIIDLFLFTVVNPFWTRFRQAKNHINRFDYSTNIGSKIDFDINRK